MRKVVLSISCLVLNIGIVKGVLADEELLAVD